MLLSNQFWFFVPVLSIIVAGIVLLIVMAIKESIKNQGVLCTLFIIFVVLAVISAGIGLYFWNY
jgi:hypothetical protein